MTITIAILHFISQYIDLCRMVHAVSLVSSIRSYYCCRRLKMYLCNKSGEKRLNGLSPLHLYKDVEVTYEEVFDIKVPKGMIFINILHFTFFQPPLNYFSEFVHVCKLLILTFHLYIKKYWKTLSK